MESEILDRRDDLSLFHKKRPIAGHAGQGEVTGVDGSDVPKVRDKNGAFCALDEILDSISGGTVGGQDRSLQRRNFLHPVDLRHESVVRELFQDPVVDPRR